MRIPSRGSAGRDTFNIALAIAGLTYAVAVFVWILNQ